MLVDLLPKEPLQPLQVRSLESSQEILCWVGFLRKTAFALSYSSGSSWLTGLPITERVIVIGFFI